MAYLAFEADGELEAEFFVAEQLHMTVSALRQMDNDEFTRWTVYFARKAQRRELYAKSLR